MVVHVELHPGDIRWVLALIGTDGIHPVLVLIYHNASTNGEIRNVFETHHREGYCNDLGSLGGMPARGGLQSVSTPACFILTLNSNK